MSWASVVVTPVLPVILIPLLLSSAFLLFHALKSTVFTSACKGATGVAARYAFVFIIEIEPLGSIV
jgi:hypothetical protein